MKFFDSLEPPTESEMKVIQRMDRLSNSAGDRIRRQGHDETIELLFTLLEEREVMNCPKLFSPSSRQNLAVAPSAPRDHPADQIASPQKDARPLSVFRSRRFPLGCCPSSPSLPDPPSFPLLQHEPSSTYILCETILRASPAPRILGQLTLKRFQPISPL